MPAERVIALRDWEAERILAAMETVWERHHDPVVSDGIDLLRSRLEMPGYHYGSH